MHTLRREAGLITVVDPGADRPISEIMTIQCCHCGGHFESKPGSGRVRGFCLRCNGIFCGPQCEKCVPTEQLLENIEKGRPLDFRPTFSAGGL